VVGLGSHIGSGDAVRKMFDGARSKGYDEIDMICLLANMFAPIVPR
jgi:hypothetical protein